MAQTFIVAQTAQRKTVIPPPPPEPTGTEAGAEQVDNRSFMDRLNDADWGELGFMAFLGIIALLALANTIKVLTRRATKKVRSGLSEQELEDVMARARRQRR